LNAVEIEEAVSQLAVQEFDPEAFPYAFLEAFGNKTTTIKRLKSGSSNASDIKGAVLQRSNIHIAVCSGGAVPATISELKASPATSKAKARYVRWTPSTGQFGRAFKVCFSLFYYPSSCGLQGRRCAEV